MGQQIYEQATSSEHLFLVVIQVLEIKTSTSKWHENQQNWWDTDFNNTYVLLIVISKECPNKQDKSVW